MDHFRPPWQYKHHGQRGRYAERCHSVHRIRSRSTPAGREIRSTQGVTPTKYRYTGQLAQAELGLDYYVSRWYDPVLGHFTQADTLVPEPGKASAFDRYAYVQNNPIRYKDPSGHDVGCAGTDASNCSSWNHVKDRSLGYKTKTPSYLETKEQKRNPSSPYIIGWTNTRTAWSIYTNLNSSIAEKYGAANYIGFWVGAHGSLAVGLAGLSCAASGPACVAAVEGALGIGAATSADGDPTNEIVVLGKFPNYLNVAKDSKGKVFDIPAKFYNSLTDEQRWELNKEFLDKAIKKGNYFYLSNNFTEATGTYGKELEYLFKMGYSISLGQKWLIPPK